MSRTTRCVPTCGMIPLSLHSWQSPHHSWNYSLIKRSCYNDGELSSTWDCDRNMEIICTRLSVPQENIFLIGSPSAPSVRWCQCRGITLPASAFCLCILRWIMSFCGPSTHMPASLRSPRGQTGHHVFRPDQSIVDFVVSIPSLSMSSSTKRKLPDTCSLLGSQYTVPLYIHIFACIRESPSHPICPARVIPSW